MRIDAISIFPEFFDVLNLSLIGKAREDGIIDFTAHQLRDFTEDKHRSVDDTPVGGGAGMVMTPEPWALALEHVLHSAEPGQRPTVIIPSPSGDVFTQRHAHMLAQRPHLVFAPGRFEGIDHRVGQWAAEDFDVVPLSVGDYVLNGGESAVIIMVEAITRLIPGVIGNPESLREESHVEDLLEYPVYTKPARWRHLDVPEVLLSGHHSKIDQWRREQQLEITKHRRPDLYQRYMDAESSGD